MRNNWENLYKKNLHHSIWPWTDLISEVKKIDIKKETVLELGCGMGANIPFFISEGYEYYGIDASSTAIKYNQERFSSIKENLKVCNFTESFPFDNKFKLIFDRASITHNQSNEIESCIKLISDYTVSGGYFIGIDWFSSKHSDYHKGRRTEDGSKVEIESVQFKDTGIVHFFELSEILNLFTKNNFTIIKIEEKIISNCLSENNSNRASFNFVAIKNV